jgi:phage tail-like protein
MANGNRKDPFSQFNFLVEIDGVTQGGFSEVSGLTMDTNIIEYREGNEVTTVRKLPGLMKYNNLVLKHGIVDTTLYGWRKNVIEGNTQRASGAVVLLDESRKPALRWTFTQGWPSKLEGPALNAKTSEAAVETLEIAHEGLQLESA